MALLRPLLTDWRTYDLQGSPSRAAEVFTKMTTRFPKDPQPWMNLAKIRELQKKPAEAIRV